MDPIQNGIESGPDPTALPATAVTPSSRRAPAGTLLMATLRWLLVVAMAGAAAASVAHYFGWLEQEAATAQEWTCPMHPTYVADHPGACPICGMDLVPKTAKPAPEVGQHEGFRMANVKGVAAVTIATERLQRIGLRHEPARIERVQAQLQVPAVVQADEAAVAEVHARVSGWVQTEALKRPGDPVREGEPLATLYSRELNEAQADFLAAGEALQGMAGADGVGKAAARRLRVLGMTDAGVRRLAATAKATGLVTLTSPRAGVIVERRVQSGQFVTPGDALFLVGKLDPVLVLADIPMDRAADVAAGLDVQFAVAAVGEATATVSRIEPSASPGAQTLRVRAVLSNPDGRWRPGLVGRVHLAGPTRDALTVPTEAIVDTGLAKYVHRLLGADRFVPTRVETGLRHGDRIEITKGLTAGDEVVTSGNFLIDAESRMAAGQGSVTVEPPVVDLAAKPPSTGPVGTDASGVGQAYLALQQALVIGDAAAAAKAAALLAKAPDPELAKASAGFPADLDRQREKFKPLSELAIRWAKAHPDASDGLVVVHCPMAEGRWLQPAGKISNPYYGEQMLECGAVQGPPGEAP